MSAVIGNDSEQNNPVTFTPAFKLKDKNGRDSLIINLKEQFSFIPEVIIIEKVKGGNNVMRLGAVDNEFVEKRRREMRAEKVQQKRMEAKKDGR